MPTSASLNPLPSASLEKKQHLEWLSLFLLLTVLAAALGYFLYLDRQQIEDAEKQRLDAQTRVIEASITRQLEAVNRALIAIRTDIHYWNRQPHGRELANHRLRAFADAMPGVRTFMVIQPDGIVWASNRPELIGMNFAKRDYFRTVRREPNVGKLYLNPPFQTVLGVFAMNVVKMVPDEDGFFDGIVSATLDPEEFSFLLDSVRNTPDMWTSIAHEDGIQFLMVPPRPGMAGLRLDTEGSFFSQYRASGRSHSVMQGKVYATGERRFIAMRSVNPDFLQLNKSLVVAATRDYELAFVSWWGNVKRLCLVFGLLVFSTGAGLAWIQHRRHQYEQQRQFDADILRRRTHEAESASEAKSLFLANMSHEIRTPMNAVLGLLQLLQRTALDGQQQEYATKAEAAARSLLGILNDILDFSKVEAGKLELESAPFRLDQVLRNLSVVLSAALGNKKEVEVLFDLDPALPHALCGDALRLQQVLLNLAGNSVKFTQHGEVVVRLVVVEQDTEQVTIAFSVQDTGIGIAEDKLAFIFEGFSQAEASTTRRFGGTGLGLAISQRLVGLMGGEISVNSVLNQGSCFHFTLSFPLNQQESNAIASRLPSQAHQGLRVLFVDDNSGALDLLSRMASRFGWQAHQAHSGDQAIALVKHSDLRFDAVFIDWQMPTKDGWDTATALHPLCHANTRLIMMVTAYGREQLASRANQHPEVIHAFLSKPVTPSMLFDAVAEANYGSRTPALSPTQRVQRLSGLHILVVEDNSINQQIARELLSQEGAKVELANNGKLGLEAIRQQVRPFDVVLMDVQMPEMDGYTATRVLRQDMGNQALPVIAMTANAFSSDREACLAAGMNDHVGKPIDLDELVQTIQRYCGSKITSWTPVPTPIPTAITATPTTATTVFDPDMARQRLQLSIDLFLTLIERFIEDQQHCIEHVATALTQQDTATAQRLLHTLKGLAATLGAYALSSQAAVLEAELKQDGKLSDWPTAQAALATLLQQTLTGLQQYLASHQTSATTSVESTLTTAQQQQLQQGLSEILPLLEQNNLAAWDQYQQLCQHLPPPNLAAWHDWQKAMNELDFPAAVSACQQLLAELQQADTTA